MARVQVNTDLGRPEQTQVVARPTGFRPPTNMAVPASPGLALARSLATLRPEIMGHIQDIQNEWREKEGQRAYDTIQGMTYDQAREAVENGTLRKTESPWFQAAFQKQFGLAHASERRRQIITAYNNEFDKENGNLDEFLAGFAREDAERFGHLDFVAAGLREGMDGVFKSIRDSHAEYQDSVVQDRTRTQFFGAARGAVDRALDAEEDPMTSLRALYGPHREQLGLSYAQMDEQVMLLAEQYAAEGNLAAAEALLRTDVVGADGTPVGAFINRPKFALDAQRILDTAAANQGRQNRERNTTARVELEQRAAAGMLTADDITQLETLRDDQQLSQDALEGLILRNNAARTQAAASAFDSNMQVQFENAATEMLTTGRGNLIMDQTVVNPHTGAETTFTAKSLIEGAATEQLNAMAAAGTAPTVMAQQMASWGVDYTYQPWRNTLTNGYVALTDALSTAKADGTTTIPEPAMAGYTLWKSMSDTPRLRDRHVEDSTAAAIYRDAEVLERAGVEPEVALLRSASIDRKSGRTSLADAVERQEYYQKVEDLVAGGWFEDDAVNGGDVSRALESHTRILMDLGLPMSKAIEEATKAFEESHTVINGAFINTRNLHLPNGFEEDSEAFLRRFAEETGEDFSDLTLVPSGRTSNHWYVAYKSNVGMPVMLPGVNSRFRLSDIEAATARTPIRDQVNAAIAEAEAERPQYSYEEWRAMSRTERKRAGLPTSEIGGQWFYRNRDKTPDQ